PGARRLHPGRRGGGHLRAGHRLAGAAYFAPGGSPWPGPHPAAGGRRSRGRAGRPGRVRALAGARSDAVRVRGAGGQPAEHARHGAGPSDRDLPRPAAIAHRLCAGVGVRRIELHHRPAAGGGAVRDPVPRGRSARRGAAAGPGRDRLRAA
ncbi:hypothetical protein OY671_012436, partial [Metschnikowia pulcherrima]